jgi:heme iron utilization protein
MTDTIRQPGEPVLAAQPADFDPVGEAKTLLRTGRAGALATLDAETSHPLATLVTVATDLDGSPVLMLSDLSQHSRNIAADGRVSLLLAAAGKGDPNAHPRLSVAATAARAAAEDVARLTRRFLARHPKSAVYAGFPDFAVYRLAVLGGHLNGGFARAARLSAAELLTDLTGAEALVAAEEGAVAHMNEDHAGAVGLYATALLGRPAGAWRLVGLDPEGADLAKGDEAARLGFPERVTDPATLRRVLVGLAEDASACVPQRRSTPVETGT